LPSTFRSVTTQFDPNNRQPFS